MTHDDTFRGGWWGAVDHLREYGGPEGMLLAEDMAARFERPEARPDWDDYFLGIAGAVAARGECSRSQVGAVLVRDRRIVSTGYNGVAAGEPSCLDGACPRGLSGVARRSEGGPGYDVAPCVAAHAEDNAVTDAYARGVEVPGATIYLTKEPCPRCDLLLRSLRLRVVWRDRTRGRGGAVDHRRRADVED